MGIAVAVSPRIPVGVTQLRVVRSEWTKFYSLRSTRWGLLAAAVLTVGLPVLFAAVLSARWGHMSPQERAGHRHQPINIAQSGVDVAQLVIGVLGALIVTGEYATGSIQSSLIAVPTRLPVLRAKTLVYAVVIFALMLPCVIVAFFASQTVLARHDIEQVAFSGAVARAVGGGAVYLTLIGVFALALGAIVRNTAGAIGLFAAIIFVVPVLVGALPSDWSNPLNPWLPSTAAQSILALNQGAHTLAPPAGLVVFAGYCAVALTAAGATLVSRDA